MLLRAARASSLLFLLVALPAVAAAADVNRIVLRVNDRIATLYEFEQRRQARIEEIQRADLTPQRRQRLLADVGVQTMREMYEELLILSRADQLEIRVDDGDVDAAVQQAKSSFNIETDEQLQMALASSGLTLEDFREQMRKNLLMREVMGREVQQNIEVEEEDLRRYYRNHPEEFTSPRRLRVREVVVIEETNQDPEDLAAAAERVRAALLSGDETADELSELRAAGRVSALVDLGWVESGDLEPALEEAVWELEAGAVSEPVPARGGLHVVQVAAVEPAELREFVDVQDQILAKLRSERFQEEMVDLFQELERSSFIVAEPPPEAAGFRAAIAPPRVDDLGGLARPPAESPEDPSGDDP